MRSDSQKSRFETKVGPTLATCATPLGSCVEVKPAQADVGKETPKPIISEEADKCSTRSGTSYFFLMDYKNGSKDESRFVLISEENTKSLKTLLCDKLGSL